MENTSNTENQSPLLEVKGLKKYFPIRKGLFRSLVGHVKAVDNVSFNLMPKETLGVVGESGCGKTTVGRSLLRLIEPTAGQALFQGKDIFTLGTEELQSFSTKHANHLSRPLFFSQSQNDHWFYNWRCVGITWTCQR